MGGWDEKKTSRRLAEHLRIRRFLELDEECSEEPPPQPLPAYLERWPGGCLNTEPGGSSFLSEFFVCMAPFNAEVCPGDLAANVGHSEFFRSLFLDAEAQYRNAQRREAQTGKRWPIKCFFC